jgi:membrane-associated phospholipid phosphatase
MKLTNSVLLLIIDKKYFFIPYLLFLLFCGIYLALIHKGSDVLLINGNYNIYLDYSTPYITLLGDGFAVLIVALIFFLFTKFKYSFYIIQSFLLSGAITQLLKKIYDIPRPKSFFAHTNLIHFVNGVNVFSNHSFPSGHTATIFSFMLLMSFITKNKYLSSLYFLLALIIGLTRIYLAQHFLIDVYVASLIGIFSTTLVFVFWEKYFQNHNTLWQNKRLFYQNTFPKNM